LPFKVSTRMVASATTTSSRRFSEARLAPSEFIYTKCSTPLSCFPH
jgi:hypothetical protein